MSAMSNARWVMASQAVRVLAQLAGIAVLARLLPPHDYGLMAMAAVVTNFAYLFRDLGSGAAIIRLPQAAPGLCSTLHWTNLGLGLAIAAALMASSPLLALAFHEQELRPVLCALALVFPLASLGVVHQSLLERESRFAPVAAAEISAALAGLGAALLLAWNGAGVYSLVAQVVVSTLTATGLLMLLSGFRPQRHWRWAELGSIAGFSANLSLFNFVLYVSRNADGMVIGRLLGAAPLGVYSLACRVMLFPVQNMSYVASRALYPVLSRRQHEPGALAALYLKSTGFVAFLTAPLMAGLFVLREPFVLAVFGPRWAEVAGVLAWLAPVGFLQSVTSTTGAVFMARGRSDLMLRLGMLAAVLQVSAFVVGARWGIEGVAAGCLLANVLNAGPAMYFSARLIGFGLSDLARALGPPVAGAVLMAAALTAARHPVAENMAGMTAALLLLTAIGAAIYAGLSLWLLRPQLGQLRLLLHPR